MIPVMTKTKETMKQYPQDQGTASPKVKVTVKQNQNQGHRKINPSKMITANNVIRKSILSVDTLVELW